jgi:hypothetical protein
MPTTQLAGTAKLSPYAFQSDPMQITIRIHSTRSRYEATIMGDIQPQRIPLALSQHDLVALNQQFQTAMQSIVQEYMPSIEPSKTDVADNLRQLTTIGHYAFKKVFRHPDARAAVEELCGLGTHLALQIVSEDFFLPWELLYPYPPTNTMSYEYFWGANHIISRLIVQDTRPGAFVSPVIQIEHCPDLGLLAYTGLMSVTGTELPFFEQLHTENRIQLVKLRTLDLQQKWEELQEFLAFFKHPFDLIHFACHAHYEHESPDTSYILLSENFPVTLMEMDVHGMTTCNHPLVVMNACETGNLNPLYTSYFAAALLKYGARGVVATEGTIPDTFAADFAQQLYSYLLAGNRLGTSLLAARRYFLEKDNNPLGLLYSMYAPPSIRLSAKETCASRKASTEMSHR